jgi:hypothetical protein
VFERLCAAEKVWIGSSPGLRGRRVSDLSLQLSLDVAQLVLEILQQLLNLPSKSFLLAGPSAGRLRITSRRGIGRGPTLLLCCVLFTLLRFLPNVLGF